jgi:hypothetical protein
VGKEEALTMGEHKGTKGTRSGAGGEQSRCQIAHALGKSPSYCTKPAKEEVDGLLLCELHALEAKLEGQIECWDEMLFHIDLWSGEARRQDRPQVVELLDLEWAQATIALKRAYEELEILRRSGMLGESAIESWRVV